jgi:hypothetical protein
MGLFGKSWTLDEQVFRLFFSSRFSMAVCADVMGTGPTVEAKAAPARAGYGCADSRCVMFLRACVSMLCAAECGMVLAIQVEEAKTKKMIKEAAKRGDAAVCKTLAKAVCHSRRATTRLHVSKAQLNSVSMAMQQQAGFFCLRFLHRVCFLPFLFLLSNRFCV